MSEQILCLSVSRRVCRSRSCFFSHVIDRIERRHMFLQVCVWVVTTRLKAPLLLDQELFAPEKHLISNRSTKLASVWLHSHRVCYVSFDQLMKSGAKDQS